MNYEKPLLVDFAPEDMAEGAGNCMLGTSAATCRLGSIVSAPGNCMLGTSAATCRLGSIVGVAGKCINGSNAQSRCQAGATALGKCGLGSQANPPLPLIPPLV